MQNTHMQNKDGERSLLSFPTQLFLCKLYILLKLTDSILEGRPGVVDLINDQDVLANQIRHLEGAKIQPLRACNLCSRHFLRVTATQVLIERESDGLNRDVGVTRTLKE